MVGIPTSLSSSGRRRRRAAWEMFLVCLWHASLIIRFDGSLRLPRDPNAGLSTVASCGSTILLDDDQTVVALGGKSIPFVPDLTSGDVEYDGLNLGLEWAVQAAERGDFDQLWGGSEGETEITIRGDCKTVIDQLNQKAKPRKLRQKYEIAKERINRLQDYALRRLGGVAVRFEHIKREENVLCDAICGCLIDLKQSQTVSTALEAIRIGEESSKDQTTRLELPASKKKRFKFTNTHFNRALDMISKSGIPYSSRLALYRKLACAADDSNDAVALRRLGEVLGMESKRWLQSNASPGLMPDNKKDLEILGILLNIRGLRLIGLDKEADKAERKHKVAIYDDGSGLLSAFISDTDALRELQTRQAQLSSFREGIADEDNYWSMLLSDWYLEAAKLVQSRVEGGSIERGIWRCCLDEQS